MQHACLGSVTKKCGCILFSSRSQFMKFHIMLKERLRCSAEPVSDPPTELKLNPPCKNSIRHKQAPAKDSHWVPFPPLEQKPLTPSYVTGILTHREARWKSWEYFRRSLTHHQRPREPFQQRYCHYFCQVILGRLLYVPRNIFNAIWKMYKGPSEMPFVKASAELTPKKKKESCFM